MASSVKVFGTGSYFSVTGSGTEADPYVPVVAQDVPDMMMATEAATDQIEAGKGNESGNTHE